VGGVGDGVAGGVPVGRARAVAVAQEGLAVPVGLMVPAGAEPPAAAVPMFAMAVTMAVAAAVCGRLMGLAPAVESALVVPTTFTPPPATLLPALAVEAVPVPVPDAPLATARVCAAVNEVPAALIVAVAFEPPPHAARSGRRPNTASTERRAPVERMLTDLASSIVAD